MFDIDTTDGPECLFKIRNPWGRGVEWNGAWSDTSSKWDTVSEEVKQSIGYQRGGDGTFFMAFDDWVDHYNRLTMCYIDKDARLTNRFSKKDFSNRETFPQ